MPRRFVFGCRNLSSRQRSCLCLLVGRRQARMTCRPRRDPDRPSVVEDRVPDRFRLQPLQAEMPQIALARVDLLVRPQAARHPLSSQLVSVRCDDQPVQPLHAVVVRDEFGRQIIQQFLIAGLAAQQSEIARYPLQSFAEMPLPRCGSRPRARIADCPAPSASPRNLRAGLRGNPPLPA